MEKNREELLYLAIICEQAEKYHDMAEAMTQIVHLNPVLTELERNIFSVAYKNIIGAIRSSIRIIMSIEDKETEQNNLQNLVRIQKYRAKLEDELRQNCYRFIDIIEKYLIPNAQDPVDKVFYFKLQGDYWRYLAEIETFEARKNAIQRSQSGYDSAFMFGDYLRPVHPIRIGLALNFSVFCCELLSAPEKAQNIILKTYEDIQEHLPTATEQELVDLEPLLRLIQNLPPLYAVNDGMDEYYDHTNPEYGVRT